MEFWVLLLSTALKIGFILAIILTFAPLIIWAERRQSAMMQDRLGPERAGLQLPERFIAPVRSLLKAGTMFHLAMFGVLALMLILIFTGATPGGRFSLDGPWLLSGTPVGISLRTAFWGTIALFFVNGALHQGLRFANSKFDGNITLLGLLHPLADALKFVFKEDFVPPKADKFLHSIAPIITVIPAVLVFAVIPFADVLYLDHLFTVMPGHDGNISGTAIPMQIASLNVGILFIFAVAGTGVVGAAVGGYASDNKYSLLGGLRAAGQMVSYEVTLGLTIVPMFMIYGTLLLNDMVSWQTTDGWLGMGWWGVFVQPLAFILFFTCSIAETKRIPFDVPEGESELAGGYLTEYSGMKFGLFFMGEFIEVVVLAAVATLIFFGGYGIPFLEPNGFEAFGYALELPHIVVVLLQVIAFLVKVAALIWLQLMVRWTLPRFRYDQIMALCWKYILPLSLINILVTGVLILLFS